MCVRALAFHPLLEESGIDSLFWTLLLRSRQPVTAEEAECTVVAVVPRNAEAGKRPTPDAQESSLPEAPEGTKALRFLLFPTQGWHFLFFGAVFFSGLVYLHENAPSLEEIDHVLRADVRQPYTLKFVLNLIASVVNALVFGPPTWKAAETTPSFKDKVQAMMKMAFVVYLLCSALYGWWHDIQAIAGIADRQFKEIVGWPEVLRFSMLVCVQTATGGMWSKAVEVYLLIHVYHEFHNFCILHWRGEGGLQACSPCNQGKLEEETTGFTKEMTGSMRMAFLIRKMGQANGRLYETYMILVLLRCLPFAWIFAFCHLVAFFVVYPWCFLLLCSCVIFMRLVAVEALLWWLRRKHVKQRQSVKGRFGRSQLKAGGFTFIPFSESESEFLLESRRHLATVGFLPGHFDRRLPGLLRIRKLPESPVVAEIQADYEEELDVLKATGHTRDAWCYIIVYTAAGKFMVDIVVVIISRFLVGAGYLESVRQTLFERPWNGWIRQYCRTGDRPKGDLLHLRGDVTCSSFYDQIGV